MEMGESVIMIFSIYVKNIYLIPLLIDYISQYNIYRFKIKNNLKWLVLLKKYLIEKYGRG